MNQNKTISDMTIGEMGLIVNMDKVEKNVRDRFLDLGIAPNIQIKLLNTINFNQLFIIEVDDVEICIRQKDAKMILIKTN